MGPSAIRRTRDPQIEDAVVVRRPARQTAALVFSSPHSGAEYPAEFVRASRLDPITLRRSEDSFVDEIFAAAPTYGAPLLAARFPRVFCDPNREPYELDQNMFEDALPASVNTSSPRVAGGLGTIARIVTSGAEIYRGKLTFAEARERIEKHWRPYHRALGALVDETRALFGAAILIDCHSMPSVGGPLDRDPGAFRPDIVLGNRHGVSCAPDLTDFAASALRKLGFVVALNNPYAGAYTTQHYGRPIEQVHALQIEINRALYMDEERVERLPGLDLLAQAMDSFIRSLSTLDPVRFSKSA